MKTDYSKIIKKQSGFTMIEIVAVLVVLGILVAVAVSHFSNIDADSISDFEKVKSHLRYAQSKSMANSNVRWGIQFSGSTYSLFGDTNGNGSIVASEQFVLPGEDSVNAVLETSTANGIIAFDWWGAPYLNVNCTTAHGGSLTVGTKTITITPETGFIP